MRYTILLNRDEKTKAIEAQEQTRFVKAVLEALDVPIQLEPDEHFTVESKATFRKSLAIYSINIISDIDGGLKIYAKDELIAEWHKPQYKLKSDRSQIDPNKRLYYEMSVDMWSIFEEQNVK